MRNIGIMLVGNERDILREVMESHCKYFDSIFCCCGGDDGSYEILEEYFEKKKLLYLIKDIGVIKNGCKVEDGVLRDYLLQEAVEQFGENEIGWVTLLHGDEIWYNDPIGAIETAERNNANVVQWHAMQFFLHESERNGFHYDVRTGIEQRKFYCPGWVEVRQFKYKKGMHFPLGHSPNVGILPQVDNYYKIFDLKPIYRHYTWRNPEQAQERAEKQVKSGFQPNNNYVLGKDPFWKIIPHRWDNDENKPMVYKKVEKFEGDFGFHEIGYKPGDRKRIFFVLPNSQLSGGAMVSLTHAGILKKNGFKVGIICDEKPMWWMKDLEYFGFEIWATKKQFIDEFKPNKDDLVIFTWDYDYDFVKSLPCERAYLVQHWQHPRTDIFFDNKLWYISVSKFIKLHLMKDFGVDSYLIPNCIEQNLIPYQVDKIANRVLVLSRHGVDWKGFKDAADVMQMVKTRLPFVEFVFVDGMRPREIREQMSKATILLYPSWWEGFGLPVLEAMAEGCVPVLYDNGGSTDFAVHNQNCLMVGNRDVIALKDALCNLLINEDLRVRLSLNGIKTVSTRLWKFFEGLVCNYVKQVREVDKNASKIA